MMENVTHDYAKNATPIFCHRPRMDRVIPILQRNLQDRDPEPNLCKPLFGRVASMMLLPCVKIIERPDGVNAIVVVDGTIDGHLGVWACVFLKFPQKRASTILPLKT